MKVRELLIKLSLNTYVGIKSRDHEEIFCFGDKRSLKIAPYYERNVLDISVNTRTVIDEENKEKDINYVEILIHHKDFLTINEAVDKVIRQITATSDSDSADLERQIDYLLSVKKDHLDLDDLLREHALLTNRLNRDLNHFTYLEWYVNSLVLMELEAINVH